MRPFGGNTALGPRVWAMPILCVAQFVVVLDATIVTSALPAIRRALGFSETGLQWVFTAYALVFGGLLIFGGRVADLAGQRRTFLIGLGLFTAASAGCALAWSPAALVTARVFQGAGAALLSPAALALLTTLSEPGAARRRAVGWWTAVAAGGGASGWVLGGLITEYAGWRWVFAVNVPLGLAAVMIAPRVLPADQRRTRASGLDLGGALTATAGLALLVYGLTSAGVARSQPTFKLAAADAGSRHLRGLCTPRGTHNQSPGAARVATISAGRWRESDCTRHYGFNHARDVSFGPVCPGRAGRSGRAGVAAVPGREHSRHRRFTGGTAGCSVDWALAARHWPVSPALRSESRC